MIFIIMGKSATGKDTVYAELLKQKGQLNLEPVVPYTTRPIRKGEREGGEYHFITQEEMLRLQRENKVVEYRTYHTVHGEWHYLTVHEERLRSGANFLYIATLDAYSKISKFYGKDNVVPIYLEVDDFVRLDRALARERNQTANPSPAEVCRRYLADEEDFSENQLQKNNITKRYNTENLMRCCAEIMDAIKRTDA